MSTTSREHSPEYLELVRRCAVRRELLGLSQRELGAIAGVCYARISSFERLARVPTAETLLKLVAAYGFQLTLEEAK